MLMLLRRDAGVADGVPDGVAVAVGVGVGVGVGSDDEGLENARISDIEAQSFSVLPFTVTLIYFAFNAGSVFTYCSYELVSPLLFPDNKVVKLDPS